MAAGEAEAVWRRTGKRVEILDRRGQRRWHDAWYENPAIARAGEAGQFERIVNGSSARPYHTGGTPERWTYNLKHRARKATLYFRPEELAYAMGQRPGVIIEPRIKPRASPNKQWGEKRWVALAALLAVEGLDPTQLGPPGARPIHGARLIECGDFRHAAAVLARAPAAVLPEGGLHHAAAAVGTPAVVIFGGFTPIEVTGYSWHINFGLSGGEACGMRLPCRHCAEAMAEIEPEQVFESVRGLVRGANCRAAIHL